MVSRELWLCFFLSGEAASVLCRSIADGGREAQRINTNEKAFFTMYHSP